MFHSARIKLTLWYVLIAFIITALFSLLAYNGFRFEFERGLQRQRIIIGQSYQSVQDTPNIFFRHIDPDLQDELRERLITRILYIDLVVIFAAAAGGYILAGRTLKPIKQMVDEQNRFITDASHELRTPLTALRSEMEATLLNEKLSENDVKSLIKSNLEEVISLQILSNNLLELARYQSSTQKKIFKQLSLLEIVEEAIKKIMPLAKKKRIVIDNKMIDTTIFGDPTNLIELFIILMDNAIKYSPPQSTIKLFATKKEKYIHLSVKDQGEGIDKEEQDKIFDRFYRTDKSRTNSKTQGYGLGLAIAKQIIDEHKGTIAIKSQPKKGSTFIITLPIK